MARPQRILTILGTRPEAIKLFPLLHALQRDPRFESILCSSGQHAELLAPVLELAGLVPDHNCAVMRHGQSLDALVASLIPALGAVMDIRRPDKIAVQGDTATAFAGALAAHHRLIEVVHVEAGLRSGNRAHPFPEEIYRKAISAMADLHCAPTPRAAQALARENVEPASVHVTGNTGIDALLWVGELVARRPELASDLAGMEQRFSGRKLVAVTAHRRENAGEGIANICTAVRRLAARDDIALIIPLHANPGLREIVAAQLGGCANVVLTDPLDYPHFARLLGMAHFVLTDSGGVQEEAPTLGKPLLVVRETTERPEGVEAGTARLIGTDPDRIVEEATRLLDDADAHAAMAHAHNPYGDGKAAGRIVELLARQPA